MHVLGDRRRGADSAAGYSLLSSRSSADRSSVRAFERITPPHPHEKAYGLWNEAKDEAHFEDMPEESAAAAEEVRGEDPAVTTPEGDPSVSEDAKKGTPGATEERQTAQHTPPLYVSLLPILVALLLIAFGAVAEAAGLEAPVIAFLGDPVFALFLGLLGAYLLAWGMMGNEHVEDAMHKGFNATG